MGITSANMPIGIIGLLTFQRNVDSPIPPCGICLQVIREFCPLEMPILLVPGNYYLRALESVKEDGVREMTLGELFPESLGGKPGQGIFY